MWPIRIECRAFLNDTIPMIPCCDHTNHHKTLCQPDTGIARVIVDIVNSTDPTASLVCKPGVDLNSVFPLPAVDCQFNAQPKYCKIYKVDEIQNLLTLSEMQKGKILYLNCLGYVSVRLLYFISLLIPESSTLYL